MTQTAPPPLAELAAGQAVAVFLDFDGTLVELAPTPDSISVPRGLAARLETLAAALAGRLALVSGRSLADISRHLGPAAIAMSGSHGLERRLADGARLGVEPPAFPAGALAELADFAARQAGLALEEKAHGAALHYRSAPQLAADTQAFASEVAAAHGLAVKHGKMVVELVPPGADKGAAVQAFMAHPAFAGAQPLFLGDDVTDEDGFAAAARLGGFGVLVGDRQGSAAQHRLPDTGEVHRWLGL